MKKLIASLAIAAAFSSYAQVPNWTLTEVINTDRSIVGYIYHTSAKGVEEDPVKKEVATSLRLICSVKNVNNPPVLLIFWDNMMGNETHQVKVTVDGKDIEYTTPWLQDSKIVYRSIIQSTPIMGAMATGKSVKFEWEDSKSVQRTVVFDLREYRKGLDGFISACKATP